jgi:hypothetical protein
MVADRLHQEDGHELEDWLSAEDEATKKRAPAVAA